MRDKFTMVFGKNNYRLFLAIRILFVGLVFLHSSFARGANIYVNERGSIVIDGSIVSGDSEKFDAILRQENRPHLVTLSSNGGDILEALEISNRIHSLRLKTAMAEKLDDAGVYGQGCHSACVLIFFSGSERFYRYGLPITWEEALSRIEDNDRGFSVPDGYPISIHRPYLPGGSLDGISQADFAEFYTQTMDLIRDALNRFGVSSALIQRMFDTPSEDAYVLKASDPLMPPPIQPSWAEYLKAVCGTNGVDERGLPRRRSILIEGRQEFIAPRIQSIFPGENQELIATTISREDHRARALYLRSVLGDWYDDEVEKAEEIDRCRVRVSDEVRNAKL